MSHPGPCVFDHPSPRPTLRRLPCTDTRVRRYLTVRTSHMHVATPGHLQTCTPVRTLVPLLCCKLRVVPSVSSRRAPPTHTQPGGTCHRRPPASNSEAVAIFPLPSFVDSANVFSFPKQSCHSILMWSYVLYHRLINSLLLLDPPQSSSRCSCCRRTTLLRMRVCFPPFGCNSPILHTNLPSLSSPTTTPPFSSFHHARETFTVGLCTPRAPHRDTFHTASGGPPSHR
jgi:hypothetical protein